MLLIGDSITFGVVSNPEGPAYADRLRELLDPDYEVAILAEGLLAGTIIYLLAATTMMSEYFKFTWLILGLGLAIREFGARQRTHRVD